MAGIEHAPALRNFIERQGWVIQPAPADYEAALAKRSFSQPVVVVPADFERDLADGIAPRLVVVSSSANQRAQGSAGSVRGLLHGFNQEICAFFAFAFGAFKPACGLMPHDVCNFAA